MQIALTKKLATAANIKPEGVDESINPIFCWTANWINTFEDRKEDMVVMVNNATFFTVAIYGVKRNQFKEIEEKLANAIRNTFLAMNLNESLIDEYFRLAGDISFVTNKDRKMTSQLTRRGLESAIYIGGFINHSPDNPKYLDHLGYKTSKRIVNYSGSHKDAFYPYDKMIEGLEDLTGIAPYNYCAFELLVTLDLDTYKATRRIIVPADIELQELHNVMQKIFKWENYHFYDFAILKDNGEIVERLVLDEELLDSYKNAILMGKHKLSDYLPQYHNIIYTYDYGDNWEHKISLVRVIENHNAQSPYLLESIGQAPPEDVGGVGGFIEFREIMLNPEHHDYQRMKEWARFWSPELSEWDMKVGVID